MVTKQHVLKAVAELSIVILGVMIALAADSWREDLQEARVESGYLNRLTRDVSAGLAVLAEMRARYVTVRNAAGAVINELDVGVGRSHEQSLLDNFVTAAETGFDPEELASDVTYNELVVSGRLNLIEDHSVRESVVAYYRGAQRLAFGLQNLPQVNYFVGSMTGYLPVEYTTGEQKLSESDRVRLLAALKNDSELTRDLRQLHSELIFQDRQFESLISQGHQLLALLE